MKTLISLVSAYYLLNQSFNYASEQKNRLQVYFRKFAALGGRELARQLIFMQKRVEDARLN